MIWGSDSTRGKGLSVHKEQEWLVAHPASCPVDTRGSFSGSKVADAGG